MAGPEDFLDPSLFYQDTPAEQTDPQVEQQDPTVHPAPAEKPDSWVFDEAMLGYTVPKAEQVASAQFFDGAKMGLVEPEPVAKSDKLSDKVVVVCDNGLFVEYAAVLARSFGKVYYHCSSGNAYRKMTRGLIGTGVEGLEILEDDIWEVDPDKVDLWVFPDVNFGHLQEELRSRGYRVWGSGVGEAMENDRVGMKRDMAAQGMPVGAYEVVKGIENLRVYLKENEDVFVKISKWRGSFESFHSKNYRVVEARLDLIQKGLGPLGKVTEFVIEQPLPDRVEIGVDCWTVDGKYPKNLLAGIEVKDKGYVGAFGPLAKLPKPIHTVNKGLAPIFKKYGYRGPFSTEIRTNGPDDAYLIDMTCRLPSPPNEIYQEMYLNAAEIAWHGANGVMVEPKPRAKFGAMVMLKSIWGDENWQPVYFPKENREYVKLINQIVIDGVHYTSPQHEGLDTIGGAIGFGDTAEAAGEAALEHAKEIEGPGIDYSKDAVKEALDAAKKAAEMGVKIFG